MVYRIGSRLSAFNGIYTLTVKADNEKQAKEIVKSFLLNNGFNLLKFEFINEVHKKVDFKALERHTAQVKNESPVKKRKKKNEK